MIFDDENDVINWQGQPSESIGGHQRTPSPGGKDFQFSESKFWKPHEPNYLLTCFAIKKILENITSE